MHTYVHQYIHHKGVILHTQTDLTNIRLYIQKLQSYIRAYTDMYIHTIISLHVYPYIPPTHTRAEVIA